MNWVIKAVYPHGGHTVMFNDAPLRFTEKQAALDRAEALNATIKKTPNNNTTYIVVEEN